jgi:hypothetical protein
MLWRSKLLRIGLEEINRFLRMSAGNIVERQGGDVVGLPLADERVVLEQILLLGLIELGL